MEDGLKRCSCGDGCLTFGACMRKRNVRIAYCGQGGGDATTQKRWDGELQAFRDAVRQGVQPATTKLPDIDRAMRISEFTGSAFSATAPPSLEG